MEYQWGFGNHFESEAIEGSLPRGQNSPKVPLKGLIPEQLSGTAFTVERAHNYRSWLYRIHPSTFHGPTAAFALPAWNNLLPNYAETSPEPLRWSPLANPTVDCDFISGVKTMVTTGASPGVAVHHYHCNRSMENRYFYNADGELILVPEMGSLSVRTEMGVLEVEPQEICVIPRGVKFQINPISKGWCRGYLGENSGQPFILPNLGLMGANALAQPRDFAYPVASFDKDKKESQIIIKFSNGFWIYQQENSPLDVVAWHGNYAPYKYDLRKYNTIGSISYDHPDPSIFTVLTSPSATPGTANVDFVIFPPRWLVAEHTFRPPYYHRNVMSEYMGLIHGVYDAKQDGFLPGGASLHNCMTAHGPDTQTLQMGMVKAETPEKVSDTMAFMFETCHIFHPTAYAMKAKERQANYYQCWHNFKPFFER